MHLPARLQGQGRMLLNQQCWVWGQDVRCREGNLLLEYGFVRQRAPNRCSASSQYTLQVQDGPCLRLWGFGLYFGLSEGEGIYLNRFEFMPRVARCGGDRWHSVGEFEGLAGAADTELLERAIGAIANYEQWVLDVYGIGYRGACLAGWSKRRLAPATVPGAWRELAGRLEALRLIRVRATSVGIGCLGDGL